MQQDAAKTGKGERTKARIVDAALVLFREHGYDATTMRMVAERAGVSLGNAYYYFKSKEVLLQAFYKEMHDAHVAASQEVLSSSNKLHDRLLGVLQARIDVTEPYRRFAALLFRQAADPDSPLNPFHEASRATREEAIQLFEVVIEGANVKVPKDLAKELPELLWTYSMGIVLFWIHDRSEDSARTRKLAAHTSDIVVKLIRLASNPLLRPLRKRVLELLRDFRVTG